MKQYKLEIRDEIAILKLVRALKPVDPSVAGELMRKLADGGEKASVEAYIAYLERHHCIITQSSEKEDNTEDESGEKPPRGESQ